MNRLRQALAKRNGKTLLGAACYFYDPIFLEIAARVGFDAIWIEMEHAAISFSEAADLCRMAAGTGMLTMIRVPDTRRESMLKAAEVGPDIIDVPMVDSPEQMNEMVRYARFAPTGARGSFSVSRAVKYGMVDNVTDEQARLNQELCLMAQVETKEAVDRIEELCAVPDIEIFVGPADLSSSYGVPGETLHPKVRQAVESIVTATRAHGKLLATACAPKDFPFWAGLGIDLLFCANDITSMKQGAQAAHASALEALQQTKSTPQKR
jgi:4-hydroxy-2-oxoheptanedioate aldolase